MIITKEKQFVFDDRSAHRTAKLIPLRMRQRHVRCLIEWVARLRGIGIDRKSTRLNSSHANISYAVFCLKKKKKEKKGASGSTIAQIFSSIYREKARAISSSQIM